MGAVALGSAAVLFLALAPSAAANNVGLVGGGAFGEQLSVNLVGSITSGPAPNVTLPSTGGGPFAATTSAVNVPGLLTVDLLSASTQGALGTSGFVTSSASLTNVNGLAGAVTAQAVTSSCHIDAGGNRLGTSLTMANVLGIPVPLNPSPNTKLTVPGVATITFNEQTSGAGPGGGRMITVNALHIALDPLLGVGSGDIILGHSSCIARI